MPVFAHLYGLKPWETTDDDRLQHRHFVALERYARAWQAQQAAARSTAAAPAAVR